MVESVKEILARLSGASHRGGAFGSAVLIAIAEVLPEGPLVSVEYSFLRRELRNNAGGLIHRQTIRPFSCHPAISSR